MKNWKHYEKNAMHTADVVSLVALLSCYLLIVGPMLRANGTKPLLWGYIVILTVITYTMAAAFVDDFPTIHRGWIRAMTASTILVAILWARSGRH